MVVKDKRRKEGMSFEIKVFTLLTLIAFFTLKCSTHTYGKTYVFIIYKWKNTHTHTHTHTRFHGIVTNVLNCDSIVSKFKLHSYHYVHLD